MTWTVKFKHMQNSSAMYYKKQYASKKDAETDATLLQSIGYWHDLQGNLHAALFSIWAERDT